MSLFLRDTPFDMDAFAQIARDMFPEETRNMHFVDTSNPHHKSRIVDYINNVSPDVRDFFFKARGGAEGYADSVIAVKDIAEFKMDVPTDQKIILMDVAGIRRYKTPSGQTDDQWLWAIAFHELGHGVVPDAAANMPLSENENDWRNQEKSWETLARSHYAETAADSFSALARLKTGISNRFDIEDDGFARAYLNTWAGLTNYATFMATNQIAIDAKIANFVSLTPQEIKSIAEKHAERFCKKPEELERAHTALNTIPNPDYPPRPGTKEFTEASAKLIKNLDAPTDSIEFNASALLINRFLQHSQTRPHAETKEWKNAGKKLAKKAEALGMGSIMATFKEAARRRKHPKLYALIDTYRKIDRELEQDLMKIGRKIAKIFGSNP